MKYVHIIGFFTGMILLLSACNNDVTYAEELKAEQNLIKDFISRQHIKVVTKMPTSFPWDDNVYYKSPSGLYFRLVSEGDSIVDGQKIDSVKSGDLIITRFIQYTLNEVSDTLFNESTIDYPYPTTFNYLDYSQVCTAWHEAVGYMKYHNARAKLIVYSKIGFSDYSDPATPMGYDLRIMVQPN